MTIYPVGMKLLKEFYVLLSPILWALLIVPLYLFKSVVDTFDGIVFILIAMSLLGIPLLFSRDESERRVLNKVRIGVAELLYLGEAVFLLLALPVNLRKWLRSAVYNRPSSIS
jgi:hypothetical protein